MQTIWYFVVHVLAFWGIWKVVDTVFHLVVPAACPQCKRKDNEISSIFQELYALRRSTGKTGKELECLENNSRDLDRLQNELLSANAKTKDLLDKVRRLRALHQINSANINEIDDIYGIGQVTAKKIIQMRPFNSLEAVERIVPGKAIFAIIEWSDRRWQQKRQPKI